MPSLSKRSEYAGNAIEEEDRLADQLVRSGRKVIRLNRGDPVAYFPTPRRTIRAFIDALKDSKTGYSYHSGIRPLREAIGQRHKRLYGLDASPEDVIVTQGVSEAILILNSMLINPGDRGIMFRPYYPLYESALELSEGVPATVDYLEKGSRTVDLDQLERRIRKHGKKAKYLIFANPSNPTGRIIGRGELKEIADIANEHDLLIVSDEIYDEIVFNGARFTSISEITKGMTSVVLGGASKSFDSTGFRIGYAIVTGSGRWSKALRDKFADYTMMRLSSNTPSEYALTEAIKDTKSHDASVRRMVGEIEKRVRLSCKLINESKYMSVIEPGGAFYVFPKVDFSKLRLKTDLELVTKLLVEEGVQITRGSGFGCPDHIRIVALAPQDILEFSISKIDGFLRRHSR